MPKREHGYYALVPVFIPVAKNSLPNQIAAATALHEAGQAGSLDAITALPGIRLHVKPGKEISHRWTSVAVEEVQPGTEERAPYHASESTETERGAYQPNPDLPEEDHEETQAESEYTAENPVPADEVTTTGRRSRAKVA